MCEYCKNVKTGEDLNPLINNDMEERVTPLTTTVYLSNRYSYPAIVLDVDSLSRTIVSSSTTIRFCPMCGCNLRKELENE